MGWWLVNPQGAFASVQQDVRESGSAIDSARAVLARAAVADVLFGTHRAAKLSYSGNLLVENRNGLIVSSAVWQATGMAERYASLQMLQDVPGIGRVTVGGDKVPTQPTSCANAGTCV
jgi:hypothetical protein